jgi:hypothetical protein
MTQHDGVMMSAGGEAAPKRGKRDDTSWADADLTGLKNEQNSRGQSCC